MTLTNALLITGVAFCLGAWLGIVLEARRWRANAQAIQRLESGGRLYKVSLS